MSREGTIMTQTYKYKVVVDDNFHYMDGERYEYGKYTTLDEAVNACKTLVREVLNDMLRQGKKPAELYESYTMFGEDPFIVPLEENDKSPAIAFSAWDCAKRLCDKLE